MEKLSNTETELKKSFAFKKNVYKKNNVRLQSSLILYCKGSIHFGIFQLAYKWRFIG